MRINTGYKRFAALLALLLAAAGSVSAQAYGGRATGIISTVNGGAPERWVDTGELSGSGGVVNSSSALFTGAGGAVTAASANSSAAGILRSSQSPSVVQGFSFNAGGIVINATTVRASAGCICCPSPTNETDPSCSASTTALLTITTGAGTNSYVASGAPNQVITVDGFGTVTLNQQSGLALGIAVTGMRIQGTAGGATYDIQVAQAQASINCASLIPSAGPVTIDGRVVTSAGRPVSRAVVTLTDMDGNTFTATTSTMGYFNIAEVPSGVTYILNVSHRQYTFNSQAIGLNDNATVTITAN